MMRDLWRGFRMLLAMKLLSWALRVQPLETDEDEWAWHSILTAIKANAAQAKRALDRARNVSPPPT